MKEYEMIQSLSGKDESGHPKAGIGIYHEILGTDDSAIMVEEVYVEKPEIRIFKDFNNIVRIDVVYEFPDDMDLDEQYALLERFFQPKNSVEFSEEELNLQQEQHEEEESGVEIPEEEKIVLYQHALTLNIISLSPRGKISLTTMDNPLFYSLVPERPTEPARILRMVFQVNDVLFSEISEEDSEFMERSVLDELERENNK